MARSRINTITNDLISDSGSVLWSFVKGEQLEFPITIDFIEDANDYTFEAVIVEGLNVSGQEEPPVTHKPSGIQTTLNVRLPNYQGTWNANNAYNAEDIVLHSSVYYRLTTGAGYINATTPDLDSNWEVTALNIIYVQFPSTIASTWAVAPLVNSPVYGFFELRVTEPNNPIIVKTWKPVRGMVEILFSPTDLVP
jgi:hypothetical protein